MHEYELEEIKREIVESRSLSIKTNNLVNALAADLKSIARRQLGYERRSFINSATAYVVTISVLLGVVKFAWDAKLDSVRAEHKDVDQQLDALKREAQSAEARQESEAKARKEAEAFYKLIAAGKRQEVLQGYESIAKLPLTATERAVFDAAAASARHELSLIAYQTGLDHARTGRWHEAQAAMQESLADEPSAAHAPEARLVMARALKELGRHREAIPILMDLSEASANKDVMDEATLLLADAQLDIQAWNDAKATLRAFVRRFPQSPHINDVRAKLASVSLEH